MTEPAQGPYGGLPFPGDFEVVPIGGTGGRLIRLGQILNGDGFVDYEHARLYLGDGKVVEAEPGGARIVQFDPHDGGMWSTGIITPPKAIRAEIVRYGYLCDGVGYSALDYFAIAAQRFKLGYVVPFLNSYVKSSGHMICSQLVDHCYTMAGYHLFDDNRPEGQVTPADLAELLLGRRASQGKHAL